MKKYLSIINKNTLLRCSGILVLAMVGSVLASVWPVLLGNLYSGISSGQIGNLSQAIIPLAVFAGIYLAAECIAILRRVLLDCVIADHECRVRQISIEKMLKLPVSYTFGHNSGEKTAQLNQGVAGMSQLIKILCNDVFATLLTAICTLIQVLLNAPAMVAIVMFLYLVVTLTISIFQIRSQNGIREQIIAKKTRLDGNICQTISNLELIRSLHAESYERERLQPSICDISKTEQTHHQYMGAYDSLKQSAKILFQVLILVLSITMIHRGAMEAGAVITVCLLFQQLIKPIDEVYRFMDETASSVVKAQTLTEVFNGKEDEVFSVPHKEHDKPDQNIVLDNVVIAAPDKQLTLAHYDHMVIPGDQPVALVGESGCGKTTIARCLSRFYPHTSGSVRLFGKPLGEYTQEELTRDLCYIPQNTFFFSGTVRDNLIYGLDRAVSDVELYDVLRKACILDALTSKTLEANSTTRNVLELQVTEGGNNFSGGQRQRLTLARAFLRTPRLYIFDESTANLDGDNADTVLSNLEEHAQRNGAGILYISHDDKVAGRCKVVIEVHNLLKKEKSEQKAA